jgi:hypothetical protein
MTKRYRIIEVEVSYTHSYKPQLLGFRLDGVDGTVNIGADGAYEGLSEIEAPEERIRWAKDQVGKYIECEDLLYKAYSTDGPTRIID